MGDMTVLVGAWLPAALIQTRLAVPFDSGCTTAECRGYVTAIVAPVLKDSMGYDTAICLSPALISPRMYWYLTSWDLEIFLFCAIEISCVVLL